MMLANPPQLVVGDSRLKLIQECFDAEFQQVRLGRWAALRVRLLLEVAEASGIVQPGTSIRQFDDWRYNQTIALLDRERPGWRGFQVG